MALVVSALSVDGSKISYHKVAHHYQQADHHGVIMLTAGSDYVHVSVNDVKNILDKDLKQ